jgi:hypothetical protein
MGAHNTTERLRNSRLLIELRRQGRSVKWLAAQMGVSRFAVYRAESGDLARGVPADWYARAARALGVPEFVVSPDPDGRSVAA